MGEGGSDQSNSVGLTWGSAALRAPLGTLPTPRSSVASAAKQGLTACQQQPLPQERQGSPGLSIGGSARKTAKCCPAEGCQVKSGVTMELNNAHLLERRALYAGGRAPRGLGCSCPQRLRAWLSGILQRWETLVPPHRAGWGSLQPFRNWEGLCPNGHTLLSLSLAHSMHGTWTSKSQTPLRP